MIDAPSRPDEAVLGVVPAPDTVFGLLALARAHVAPLVNRLWRGEGALLAVNVSIALAARPDPRTLLASVAVSTAVLVLLYMLNDVYDCHQDLHDAGKDQVFVRFCIRDLPLAAARACLELAFAHDTRPRLAEIACPRWVRVTGIGEV